VKGVFREFSLAPLFLVPIGVGFMLGARGQGKQAVKDAVPLPKGTIGRRPRPRGRMG